MTRADTLAGRDEVPLIRTCFTHTKGWARLGLMVGARVPLLDDPVWADATVEDVTGALRGPELGLHAMIADGETFASEELPVLVVEWDARPRREVEVEVGPLPVTAVGGEVSGGSDSLRSAIANQPQLMYAEEPDATVESFLQRLAADYPYGHVAAVDGLTLASADWRVRLFNIDDDPPTELRVPLAVLPAVHAALALGDLDFAELADSIDEFDEFGLEPTPSRLRVAARSLHIVHDNLAIGNVSLIEFAESADADGVYRETLDW